MNTEPDREQREAYEYSQALLRACATPYGFVAAVTEKDNYRRVFSRDSAIMSIAALATGADDLTQVARASLKTLANNQGEHGQIPSNVDAESGHVSYGGTAGRVDATLWFIIAAVLYYRHTNDENFIRELKETLDQAIWILGAWEFNQKGLIYVPATGDWADEYPIEGYKLYDQLLYLKALRAYASLGELFGVDMKLWQEKEHRLVQLIRANYWPCALEEYAVYHKVIEDAKARACEEGKLYWVASCTSYGYDMRFGVFANVLASLVGIADEQQIQHVDAHIGWLCEGDESVVPAFDPVIEPGHADWDSLRRSFSFSFKNKPYEYHNGGRWPMVTGFYVLDLARRGKREEAARYLAGINRANKLGGEGEDWGFYEFLHGKTGKPMGTRHQGWSAAAGVLGYHALYTPDTILF